MSDVIVLDIGRKALMMVLLLGGPMLIIALVVGLAISIFQAATQINEMTMTFIPKLVAVGLAMLFFLPWMLQEFKSFFIELMGLIPQVLR